MKARRRFRIAIPLAALVVALSASTAWACTLVSGQTSWRPDGNGAYATSGTIARSTTGSQGITRKIDVKGDNAAVVGTWPVPDGREFTLVFADECCGSWLSNDVYRSNIAFSRGASPDITADNVIVPAGASPGTGLLCLVAEDTGGGYALTPADIIVT